ncbi:MAG: FAD-binding protein [Thermodesulfovibrionales bacterium]
MEEFQAKNWPYEVKYEKENKIETDVLILGGGIAGCHAAISAIREGVKVVIVEKGATKWSGNGGAGVDHWQAACANPCCKIAPEEMTEAVVKSLYGYECGIKRYIQCVEGYETLLDVEKMGVRIRDERDEFKGAEFRDDHTKLLFAYDYKNRHTIRVWGNNMKPSLFYELKRLGVEIYDRVMTTGLLTESGKRGKKVIGATGINIRTGEFFIFLSRATVIAIPEAERLWDFPEPHAFGKNFHDPNCSGDGLAIAWEAGAALTLMEKTIPTDGNLGYIPYGVGNAHNTWHGCSIIDVEGKEVRWFDRDGREIIYSQRFLPTNGQKFFIDGGSIGDPRELYEVCPPLLDPNLPEHVKNGKYVLPFYADLPSMPEQEQKALFGLMVGNEGRTFILRKVYTEAGFNPEKHLLQVPVLPPEGYRQPPVWWYSVGAPQWRRVGRGGGLVVDWDLKTNLEGLYAAGSIIFGHGDHAGAATSGRYAGRKAARYARSAVYDRINCDQVWDQVKSRKAEIYSFIKRRAGIRWKELNAGISRVMQDFCGVYKHESTLKTGLKLLWKLKEEEIRNAYAPNPHELGRLVECLFLVTVGEIVFHASLARRASSRRLNFFRIDYSDIDPQEWAKFITLRKEDGDVKIGQLPLNYYLSSPYSSYYEVNYRLHCDKEV